MLKYIFLSLFLLFSIAHGASSDCPVTLQNNGIAYKQDGTLDLTRSQTDLLWECPSLINITQDANQSNYPYTHKLFDVDFATGRYSCTYSYKNSGNFKQTCNFSSKLYTEIVQYERTKLSGKMGTDGTLTKGLFSQDDISFSTFNEINTEPFPNVMLNVENNFNIMRKRLKKIENGDVYYSAVNKNPRAVKSKIQTEKHEEFSKINDDLIKLQKLASTHLVDPYLNMITGTPSTIRKGYTLSNFISGVVTLDPNIVKGYNPNNGKLLIQTDWENKASAITLDNPPTEGGGWWNSIKNWVGLGSSPADLAKKKEYAETLYNGDVQYKIYSYAKLFESQLWGFYYLVQERFDIGYSALASTLLLLMSSWFFLFVGIGEGVKYFSDRDNYKMRFDETAFTKTLIVLATLSMFFLSMPSGGNTTTDTDGAFQSNEMKKNYTLAKKFIRVSAQFGANTANMFNDLGLSAFVQFIVKKEMMLNIEQIRRGLETSIEDMYMYAPALQLRSECQKYYNSPSDVVFLKSVDDLSFTVADTWKESHFAQIHNISSIDYNVCKKAYSIYAIAPYQIAEAIGEAEEQIKNADSKLSEATYLMTYNNITLNDKMGWVSGFSMVLEYLILKENDMFLSPPIDREKVKETAEKITGSTTKDGDSLVRASLGGNAQDNTAYGIAEMLDMMNGLFIYNILPGFSDIQSSIYKYGKNLYGSKLEIALAEENKSQSELLSGFFSKAKSALGKLKLTPFGKFFDMLVPDITSSMIWHTLIMASSYIIAIAVWQLTFKIIFTILVSLLFLISFIMYFFDLIVHFVASLFMFVWAFSDAKSGQGNGKIKEWFKNTMIVVMLKPSILIFGLYIFIFIYELIMMLYTYVYSSITTNLMASISLMNTANNKTGLFDSISAYTTVNSMSAVAEVTIDLFALYIAYLSIIKIPAMFYKKLGVDSDDVSYLQQTTETTASRAEKHNSPIQ